MEKLIKKLKLEQQEVNKFLEETPKDNRERLMYFRGKKNQLAFIADFIKKEKL